jgi:hypothetical protein
MSEYQYYEFQALDKPLVNPRRWSNLLQDDIWQTSLSELLSLTPQAIEKAKSAGEWR